MKKEGFHEHGQKGSITEVRLSMLPIRVTVSVLPVGFLAGSEVGMGRTAALGSGVVLAISARAVLAASDNFLLQPRATVHVRRSSSLLPQAKPSHKRYVQMGYETKRDLTRYSLLGYKQKILTAYIFVDIIFIMKKSSAFYNLYGHIGLAGHHRAFLGFASASLLKQCTFVDLFMEDTGEGYQRPINHNHALDFKNYILCPGTSTIPLAFNLRTEFKPFWSIKATVNGSAVLSISPLSPCLSLIDGQHRLQELLDVDVSLAFIAYLELDLRTEMALFNTINSKAKGISSSLTDYHQSVLLSNLAEEAPHLYIARRLQEDPVSPWYQLIRYGGETTSGLKRRTSLRMMQHSIQRILQTATNLAEHQIDTKYITIRDFWSAVKICFPCEWENHRNHLLTKGIGLYALSGLMSDWLSQYGPLSFADWVPLISNLTDTINWRSDGPFAAISGRKGANSVHRLLRKVAGL